MSAARNIKVRLHRKGSVVWIRHYLHRRSAIRRASELAATEGLPQDVLEIEDDADGGIVLGLIKVRMVGGRIHLDSWFEREAL